MKVKFNDSEDFLSLDGYSITNNIIALIADGIEENLNGFILYENDKKTVVRNCSNFVYRWDIYKQTENQITYTNLENFTQDELPKDDDPFKEIIFPLTNEELTDCIADLMYETSLMKIGMEG